MLLRINTSLKLACVQLKESYTLEGLKEHGIDLFNQLNDKSVQNCIIDIRGIKFLFNAMDAFSLMQDIK